MVGGDRSPRGLAGDRRRVRWGGVAKLTVGVGFGPGGWLHFPLKPSVGQPSGGRARGLAVRGWPRPGGRARGSAVGVSARGLKIWCPGEAHPGGWIEAVLESPKGGG